MGVRAHAGRYSRRRQTGAPLVAVVNQMLAQSLLAKGDVIGRRIRIGTQETRTPWVTIVGVVANTKINSPDAPDHEQIYVPAQQRMGMSGQFAPTDRVASTASSFCARRCRRSR